MLKDEKNIPLTFQQEEEITSIYLLEDLIKEYNTQMIDRAPFRRKPFLSLQERDLNPKNPIIRPMTLAEIEAVRAFNLTARDKYFLTDILKKQFSLPGLVGNIPAIAAGATVADVINELGLKGKVTYKTSGDKTYVILKGLAKDRVILKGTRYLNTHPDIIRLGLAKVSVSDLFKTGFRSSILIYSGIKAMDGVKIFLENGALESDFFTKIGTDIPKLAINSLAASLTAGGLALIGCPVAIGAGIVVVAGFGANIGLELIDNQIGLTERFNEAVDTMWKNLKKSWNDSSYDQDKISTHPNLLEGLVFRTPSHRRHLQWSQKGKHFVYII